MEDATKKAVPAVRESKRFKLRRPPKPPGGDTPEEPPKQPPKPLESHTKQTTLLNWLLSCDRGKGTLIRRRRRKRWFLSPVEHLKHWR